MLVELEDIPAKGLEITFDLKPAFFDLAEDKFDLSDRVSFSCSLVKSGKKVYMSGDVNTELKLVCARCLEAFTKALKVHLDIDYLPKWSMNANEDVELERDDLNKYFYEGELINLRDAVSDYIATAVPMKPLCCEHCKGLCHKCGKNLNAGTCDCDDDFDDRFEILQRVKL